MAISQLGLPAKFLNLHGLTTKKICNKIHAARTIIEITYCTSRCYSLHCLNRIYRMDRRFRLPEDMHSRICHLLLYPACDRKRLESVYSTLRILMLLSNWPRSIVTNILRNVITSGETTSKLERSSWNPLMYACIMLVSSYHRSFHNHVNKPAYRSQSNNRDRFKTKQLTLARKFSTRNSSMFAPLSRCFRHFGRWHFYTVNSWSPQQCCHLPKWRKYRESGANIELFLVLYWTGIN